MVRQDCIKECRQFQGRVILKITLGNFSCSEEVLYEAHSVKNNVLATVTVFVREML